MKRAIELIRVSTEAQASRDRASIPAQRAINQQTALRYGLEIVRTIQITDVSGTAVLKAPETQELITLMGDPEVHGVVTREFSRLMRPENFTDFALLQVFVDTNTWLYLPEGPINFASTDGRLLGTLRAVMAGVERLDMLKKIWTAKEEKRQRGGFAQSRICLPFGVDYNDGWCYTAKAERVKEAFRLFLSGDTSYTSVGAKVDIPPYNLRVILRNPIYTGWRVIDKKRDTSPSGKYTTKDGRQGDRRKIARAPEEVIRKKVMDPLISEADFAQVQRIMDLKKSHYWRTRSNDHRFTYNGFLSCALCGNLIYTKYRRRDYYVCKKGRACPSHYMRRELVEPQLDRLFTQELTDIQFLRKIVASMKESKPVVNTNFLVLELESLREKRKRVLDGYFEGVITAQERDERLTEIERKRGLISELQARKPSEVSVNAEGLAQLFGPFVEFDLLKRDHKRRLLSTLAPEVLIADYKVAGISIGTNVSHTDRDS